jgi:amidase
MLQFRLPIVIGRTGIIGVLICLLQPVSSPSIAEANSGPISQQSQVTPARFNLEEATIASIQTALKTRQISCEQLTAAYLEQIKRYNLTVRTAPPLNAIVALNPAAVDAARALDRYFEQTGQWVGPLHCIPTVVKDNIDTQEMTTSVGSFALLGTQAINDAFLVKQLRQAGAIILAKTGMDEFASGLFGISSRSGRIGNAYNPWKNPGGSSGGSAVAVSANFAVIGIGTDNSGSIRVPAAFNGLVGLRPSTGLISQGGIFPAGNLDGVAGPMARTVTDLVQVLDIMAQPDPNDLKTQSIPRQSSYSSYLKPQGLQGKRIGVVRQVGDVASQITERKPWQGMPQDIQKIFRQAEQAMKKGGAEFVDVKLPGFNSDRLSNMAGMGEDIDAYLASFPAARRDLRDICTSKRTHQYGDESACLRFVASLPPQGGAAEQAALQIFAANKRYVETLMDKQKLDALLLPISTTGSATDDPEKINTWSSPISSNAGLPSLVITAGYDARGMPVGMELVTRQFAEGTLLEMAYAYEQQMPQRRSPKLEPEERLTTLSIAEFNNLVTLLGVTSYEEVLSHANPQSLTAARFKDIAQRILRPRP